MALSFVINTTVHSPMPLRHFVNVFSPYPRAPHGSFSEPETQFGAIFLFELGDQSNGRGLTLTLRGKPFHPMVRVPRLGLSK